MRGFERFNFPAFDTARDWLIEKGIEAVSPADLDRAIGLSSFAQTLPEGFIYDALRRDFMAICQCDAIVFLPGWEQSSGARAERFVGEQINLRLFHIDLVTGELTEESADFVAI